jgi:membrane-bound metal-dependent hydrolase YbcI (DUF457 family)
MPSPIGHAIDGAAVGWALTPRRPRVVAACAILAATADLDLVIPQGHRMASHSIAAVAAVTIVAGVVTGKVTRRGAPSVVAACAAAYASHLLLDWLASDPSPPRGLQLLWPFTSGWYISGLDLFRGTARRNIFTARSLWINATAIAQEIAILGPIAWVTWRRANRNRGSWGS